MNSQSDADKFDEFVAHNCAGVCKCDDCQQYRHDAKEEKMGGDNLLNPKVLENLNEAIKGAPAQATREQLVAALKEIVKSNKLPECKHYLADAVLCDGCHYSRDIRVATAIAEAERLLGGK